ncbi:hypothetical protein FNF29_01058 [Cafeteria roenbergensis]|uniref:CP-type G domain-containing protein n=1 Tax=Cafeteria roenbergensis TaxID=33653 RepID=A0A5A8CT06_CAFRO|nr:hypothetical protein FNF29_01058 [Cafeteria roenbergensis]|eukprot:KAA0156265.1 hypothetical protein FNF29_01058 [Cafeteria roenbergensis]
MPKQRTKTKRQTLKTKYAVDKKVKEHNRKLRKDLRKNPLAAKKLERDPGIPNLNPFKVELEAKMRRSAKLIEQSNLHQQRRASELARRRQMTDAERLREMASGAAARAETHKIESTAAAEAAAMRASSSTSADTSARAAADTSRKTFYKHLRTVMTKADIILEVLDARDPLACRAPEIEAMILRAAGDKKLVLVLNKIDLVPPSVVQAWLKYLRQSFPAVAFKASTQQQKSHLSAAGGARVNQAVRSGEVLTGSGSAGTDILLQLIKNYSRSHDKKKAVTVGIIGYPNVGKSSIVNSLKRHRAVGVSPVPGFTKQAQEVQLDAKIRLLDCPGIIFDDGAGSGGLDDGGAGLLLRNCVSVESMPDPELAVAGILRRCEPTKLMSLYRLPRFSDADEFLTLVARQRGKLLRGNEPDITAAARAVLQDWNSGAIPFFTAPPAMSADVERSAIVTEWGKALDMDALERAEEVAVFGGPAAAAASSAAAGMAIAASAMPATSAAATAALEGEDDEEDDDIEEDGESDDEDDSDDDAAEPGLLRSSGLPAGSSSSAPVALPRAAVSLGWDDDKIEDKHRRRAAAAAKPVRAVIAEEEAAETMLAQKQSLSAKKLRKERRRAARSAGDGAAAPSSSGAAVAAAPKSSAPYDFGEFF